MGTSPKRVLFVEGNVDGTIGGSYFSLLHLVSGLDCDRHEPLVVFASQSPLLRRFQDNGIRTLIRPLSAGTQLPSRAGRMVAKGLNFCRGFALDPLSLAHLLRAEHIDLVHLNNSIVTNHPWMVAARIAGIPCITHERGINKRFPARARWLARSLDAIVCISAAVRDNLIACGLGHLPLVTIQNGLDPRSVCITRTSADIRAELEIGAEQRLVGIIGNIRAWKGQEVVIQAIGLLREEFPQLVCLMVGEASPEDVSYKDRLEALIEQLQLRGRVLMIGYRSDVANYVGSLEIQIHASISPEPFGRVLLEAMAQSKPLVASGGGAVPEIVLDGQTGLLYEPGNPVALAAALRTLLGDPVRAAAMGRAGRERLEAEFSIRHNVEETQALYDRVLSQ